MASMPEMKTLTLGGVTFEVVDEAARNAIEELESAVFGYVDENNNIIIKANLSDGTYTIKYEMEDGSTVDIGVLDFTPGTATQTNLIPTAIGTDGSAFGTNGIKNASRFNSSGSVISSAVNNTTGLIACNAGDVVYLYHAIANSMGNANQGHRITFFDTSKAILGYEQPWQLTNTYLSSAVFDTDGYMTQFTVAKSGYFAVTGHSESGASDAGLSYWLDENSIITINEPIE